MNLGQSGKTKPIPDELYSEWKSSGAFDKGIAIILGKVWHNPIKTESLSNWH